MQIGRKAPPPPFLPFGEILDSYRSTWHNFMHRYFMHHWTSLWFLWQKSPPPTPGWGKNFWLLIYPFQAISSNFGFCGRKAPPPPPQDEGKFFDFRKIFWLQIYPFQAILSNFGFCGRKAPPQDEGKFFDFRSIHFRQFRATLVFVAEKPPPPPTWGKIFWLQIYPFQAISSNFGFCGRKAPPRWGKIFWLQIYPFQAILSNFGFCGRKAPPPPGWGKIFWLQIYPFQAISSNFGFCGRNPPPNMRENFLT